MTFLRSHADGQISEHLALSEAFALCLHLGKAFSPIVPMDQTSSDATSQRTR